MILDVMDLRSKNWLVVVVLLLLLLLIFELNRVTRNHNFDNFTFRRYVCVCFVLRVPRAVKAADPKKISELHQQIEEENKVKAQQSAAAEINASRAKRQFRDTGYSLFPVSFGFWISSVHNCFLLLDCRCSSSAAAAAATTTTTRNV